MDAIPDWSSSISEVDRTQVLQNIRVRKLVKNDGSWIKSNQLSVLHGFYEQIQIPAP